MKESEHNLLFDSTSIASHFMNSFLRIAAAVILATLAMVRGVAADDREEFFESRIRPVLVGTCFRCHGDARTGGGLRVDGRESLIKGGESGPAIVPGMPDESLLLQAIRRQADVVAMPPEKDKALRADQIADFVTWIKAGAVWPVRSPKFEATRHWAFEPIRDPMPPAVHDEAWCRSSVDRFIRAKQVAAAVHPAAPADKRTLIRRATYDLTGLPPTGAEVEAFQQDASPQAFQKVVDRLLQSAAYGERWGRHWLDVVRYADTAGETADYPVPQAWRYRNYVIDAFNVDKPYDEFLREQIAGDVIADPASPARYAEQVTATGFLAISRRFGFDSENYHHLTIQDTIDTLGQSVLGLSLGCARCHDHKFDPVSMQDYYGLYGIFDSSRYSFPGSEQKPKTRSLAPLVPFQESQPKWRVYENHVAGLVSSLTRQKQPVPAAILRSLSEMDGDFEMQAPAAGGSKGVLVPPWLFSGNIAVTTDAQSPFTNLHPLGRVGVSVSSASGPYRIAQAVHPTRTADTCPALYFNLDFRVGDLAIPGGHHISLGTKANPAVELRINHDFASIRMGDTWQHLAPITTKKWCNLQLDLDLKARRVSGRIGSPGNVTEFGHHPFLSEWNGVIDYVSLDTVHLVDQQLYDVKFDNLGIQDSPIAPVSTEPPMIAPAIDAVDLVALNERLRELTGIDGDLELQTADAAPVSPWNPGPNSVVKLTATSQSPFRNIFGAGELGLHLPNRGEYDGFGVTLVNLAPDKHQHKFVSFDFRCAGQEVGGNGSWRYYLGHGPGLSAAIELFFNGNEFFRRSADAKEAVSPLKIGEWYQVQLALDLSTKTYQGQLLSRGGKAEFTGQFASGWDGVLNYSFIDSYGHLGGVRPSLDADNFVIGDKPLPPLDAPEPAEGAGAREDRRAQVAQIRQQLAKVQGAAEQQKQELNALLTDGPFPMAYGMAEGTPHNVRIQMRGEPDQPGDEVPRGFIKVLGGGPLAEETMGSGRRELAEWLTRSDNPLVARVMVNRIWQYHFGRGLVKTPNDFGARGLPPTHPELLDHLATQFVRHGWSVKSLHRLIMTSATYQQQASDRADSMDLYTSFVRRRLSAEEIRDSVLMVTGELDSVPGREHPFPVPIGFGYSQHGPFNAIYDHNKRSVYLMTQRLKRHPFLALFDGADPNASTAERLGTTVPTQALYFLNDPFVHTKADKWAERLLSSETDVSKQIDRAWLSVSGRPPTDAEQAEAAEFLAAYRAEAASSKLDNVAFRALSAYLRALLGGNEFLHVD
ncbi:MAG: PSD1 domain-containing protein [Planctomycetes bacterium]|nr:PSD1 domain-containing protein [Planctomycetota bacterium]